MGFFHQNGYQQAVSGLLAERQAAVDRIEAELKVAVTDVEVQRLRQELVQVEASFQDRQGRLLNCLF